MQCCMCGVDIEDGDVIVRLAAYKYQQEPHGSFSLVKKKFEDGTDERLVHIHCPAYAGAPLSMIGAEGSYVHD